MDSFDVGYMNDFGLINNKKGVDCTEGSWAAFHGSFEKPERWLKCHELAKKNTEGDSKAAEDDIVKKFDAAGQSVASHITRGKAVTLALWGALGAVSLLGAAVVGIHRTRGWLGGTAARRPALALLSESDVVAGVD